MSRCHGAKLDWTEGTLLNDEASSNEELLQHFIKEGPMTPEEAAFYVGQRNRALREGLSFELEEYKPQSAPPEIRQEVHTIKCEMAHGDGSTWQGSGGNLTEAVVALLQHMRLCLGDFLLEEFGREFLQHLSRIHNHAAFADRIDPNTPEDDFTITYSYSVPPFTKH